MGLSGRKEKQRIGADPRNLSWADDAAKFGQAYLSKMGWDPSQGLGANGDGRTSHIKVAQKLNMLGIGAGAQQQGPDGVAWKQSRDYELLLKRLNESVKDESADVGVEAEVKEAEEAKVVERGESTEGETSEKRKKKRKGGSEEGCDEEEGGKKKRKKEGKEKGKKNKAPKPEAEQKSSGVLSEEPVTTPEILTPPVVRAPRPMAHRARFLRSKQLASISSTAVNEILGISGSATPASQLASTSASPYPPGSPAPHTDQELTTATKSVADYFKEKLAARVLIKDTVTSPSPLSRPGSSSAAGTVASDAIVGVVPEIPPRRGIGSKSALGRDAESDSDRPRTGLGMGSTSKFGGLMGGVGAPSVGLPNPSSIGDGSGSGTSVVRPDEDGPRSGAEKSEKKREKDRSGEKKKKVDESELQDDTELNRSGSKDEDTIEETRKKKRERKKEMKEKRRQQTDALT
ncbi:hypothetical protein M0805_008647 [Coniferiporia weirii]|nr:hypothetical protein M0805_008647 [Coniferiporia weirii]